MSIDVTVGICPALVSPQHASAPDDLISQPLWKPCAQNESTSALIEPLVTGSTGAGAAVAYSLRAIAWARSLAPQHSVVDAPATLAVVAQKVPLMLGALSDAPGTSITVPPPNTCAKLVPAGTFTRVGLACGRPPGVGGAG